jgi:hypothetical protein
VCQSRLVVVTNGTVALFSEISRIAIKTLTSHMTELSKDRTERWRRKKKRKSWKEIQIQRVREIERVRDEGRGGW